jgi:hypothetical protein
MLPDAQQHPYKLRLVGTITGKIVTFNTMPSIYENNSATYETLSPAHMIGDFHVFSKSPSRSFEISELKLVSRNQQEARANIERVFALKGWTKSYFGNTDGDASPELMNWLGAPPEVLKFSAIGYFNEIPVVLEKVSINFPNDVDYIPTASLEEGDPLGNIPFPLVTSISFTILEQHSASEYEMFNLHSYRTGTLPSF